VFPANIDHSYLHVGHIFCWFDGLRFPTFVCLKTGKKIEFEMAIFHNIVFRPMVFFFRKTSVFHCFFLRVFTVEPALRVLPVLTEK
jgi:hypothetical protein